MCKGHICYDEPPLPTSKILTQAVVPSALDFARKHSSLHNPRFVQIINQNGFLVGLDEKGCVYTFRVLEKATGRGVWVAMDMAAVSEQVYVNTLQGLDSGKLSDE